MDELELNKIYCEPCLKTMGRMPDKFLNLTVTSPPYDSLRNYMGYTFEFEPIAKELYRVTKDGGVLVWVVGDSTVNGDETGTSFKQALFLKEVGFKLHDTMIYNRTAMPNSAKRYNQDFEYMFVFVKGKLTTFNPLTEACIYAGVGTSPTSRNKDGNLISKGRRVIKNFKVRSNIWTYTAGLYKSSMDRVAFEHPAIFPEKLAQDHILSWSNKGDLVYDPFAGSGTTLKMASLEGRNYIGSEISEKYCEIIKKRLQRYE